MKFEFDVFLSHSSQDKARVRRLAERLRDAGVHVWFDEWSIPLGEDILLAIERGMERSRVQLLCMSSAAFGSDWVGLERNTTPFRNPTNKHRRFIPLLLSDCRIPDVLQRYKFVDFTKESEAAFQEILSALTPELAAAYLQGSDAHRRYLSAEKQAPIVLNEAKLIVVGEGGVGKSRLLDALCDEKWIENAPKRRGVEVRQIRVQFENARKEITLNAWDFAGQQIYRSTHQMFFTAAAIYLVVWMPREGSQQGMVKEWIDLIRRRAAGAKIVVVATCAGPTDRQPDLNRQEILDQFGKDLVVDFLHVDSRPHEASGRREGIDELRSLLARLADSFPEMERTVPAKWQMVRNALIECAEAFISKERLLGFCRDSQVTEDDARLFTSIERRLGRLIYYERDSILPSVVILKPNWLATAISFVFSDMVTQDSGGFVPFSRLCELWNDQTRSEEFQYDSKLHPVFLRLMERFDLCCHVNEPNVGEWPDGMILIPDLLAYDRPQSLAKWSALPAPGDQQQTQICKIVDFRSGLSTSADGVLSQLIVRLHKFSFARLNQGQGIQWQRGMVLVDEYGATALLELIAYDIRITVRAPYPERFLSILTHEVKSLVESSRRWEGILCNVMVPCIEPCGMNAPGTGLYEVEKLYESKRNRPEYPCTVCGNWQNIDCLLRNAPAAQPESMRGLLGSRDVLAELNGVRLILQQQHGEAMGRFNTLDATTLATLSKVDENYTRLMQALTDEAKDGPRLFSLVPEDPKFFDLPNWMSQKFRLTLFCEHSRLPLPLLSKGKKADGEYTFDIKREWLVTVAPYLKLLAGTLSLVVPVASAVAKLEIGDEAYKEIEDQLDLGQKTAESLLGATDKFNERLDEEDGPSLPTGDGAIRAHGAVLRQLHALLKEKDPGFGGLVRVQNKRQEFLWVHPMFEEKY